MPVWIIEPRDPLIVRDGRPFNPTPGAQAVSLHFPFPSTTTGGARTRAGTGADDVFDTSRIAALLNTAVAGPLFAQLDDAGEIARLLVPAPSDAVYFPAQSNAQIDCRPLVPLQIPTDAATDLPPDLAPVGLPRADPRKPAPGPAWWYWDAFEGWLLKPIEQTIKQDALGHAGPTREQRTHVRIERETQTADEGGLFQTRGLEFTDQQRRRFGLAIATEAELRRGLAPLAGERRLVAWRPSTIPLPSCHAGIRAAIHATGTCRVLLLTPACFDAGFRPRWLLDGVVAGVSGTLSAVATPRPHVVSGWDFARRAPKPTRRLAAAGSVYFVKLTGSVAQIDQWIDRVWMHSISDAEQDRRDGFGLAALGLWSGSNASMEAV